jgi:hypothetical protein
MASTGTELVDNTMQVAGVAAIPEARVLRAVGIYGANASGKSNLVRGLRAFSAIIGRSAKESTADDPLPVVPFGLDKMAKTKPTRFCATFVVDQVLYEYEIAVTRKEVEAEQLSAFPRKLRQRLFQRTRSADGQANWQFSRHFPRDKALEARTRSNSLYLSVGAQFNHPLLSKIYSFFGGIDFREPRNADAEYHLATVQCMRDEGFRAWAAKLLHDADTGIEELMPSTVDVTAQMPSGIRRTMPKAMLRQFRQLTMQPSILARRRIFETQEVVEWDLERESDGTKQLLSLLRSWYALTRRGNLVVIDELDASLHSRLSRQLLKMANDPSVNSKGGQLIFTTHDTTLLDPTLLRRDQIYFAERTAAGASRLYSLLDYAPRKDEALQKGYLAGRYGAVPFLGEFRFEPQTTPKSAKRN